MKKYSNELSSFGIFVIKYFSSYKMYSNYHLKILTPCISLHYFQKLYHFHGIISAKSLTCHECQYHKISYEE